MGVNFLILSFFLKVILIIGKKSDDYDSWDNWYFYETQNKSKGWVPK